MSVENEYEKFKNSGGAFALERGIIKISGPDSGDFLHRLTTQNIKGLTPGNGVHAALLQSNAAIISLFDLYNSGQFFLLVVEQPLMAVTAEHLEKMHFAEDLEIQDASEEFRFLSVQGPKAAQSLRAAGYRLPKGLQEISGAEECFVVNEPDFGSEGYHLLVKSARFGDVKKKLENGGIPFFSRELWQLLRSEAGHFTFGVDITPKNLILEAATSDYVSRNKGCYPGQEVVERVFTYGNVAKKLVGLELDAASAAGPLAMPVRLFADGKEVGLLTSLKIFPWSKKCFGFGVVRKPHYEPGQILKLESVDAPAKVVLLPHSFDIHRELHR